MAEVAIHGTQDLRQVVETISEQQDDSSSVPWGGKGSRPQPIPDELTPP